MISLELPKKEKIEPVKLIENAHRSFIQLSMRDPEDIAQGCAIPVDEVGVRVFLEERYRITLSQTRNIKKMHLSDGWMNRYGSGLKQKENFDEAIFQQQLDQRLGWGPLTQKPDLEWLSLEEAAKFLKLPIEEIITMVHERKLFALMRSSDSQPLIHLNENFLSYGLGDHRYSLAANIKRMKRSLSILSFASQAKRYGPWQLYLTEREIFLESIVFSPKNRCDWGYSDKIRYPIRVEDITKKVAAVELQNFPTHPMGVDIAYLAILSQRTRLLPLGLPSLRYFTLKEAAFYLRTSELSLLLAVEADQLVAYSNGVVGHLFFEKSKLISYAGPSSNPIKIDSNFAESIKYVKDYFGDCTTSLDYSKNSLRTHMKPAGYNAALKRIRTKYLKLAELSLWVRAENLFFYNLLFNRSFNFYMWQPRLNNFDKFSHSLRMGGPRI